MRAGLPCVKCGIGSILFGTCLMCGWEKVEMIPVSIAETMAADRRKDGSRMLGRSPDLTRRSREKSINGNWPTDKPKRDRSAEMHEVLVRSWRKRKP